MRGRYFKCDDHSYWLDDWDSDADGKYHRNRLYSNEFDARMIVYADIFTDSLDESVVTAKLVCAAVSIVRNHAQWIREAKEREAA